MWGTALYRGHQATPWGTRALCFGVYTGDCVVVCLFAVVGGMLCKSDKPSIIIIITTVLYLGHQATPWGTRALGFGVYVGDCVVVCLFTVVGGMLCKSDKPSIIIITALHQGHQATPWGTRALGFGVYVGDCAVSGSSGNTLGHEGRDGAVLPQRAGWGCLA